MASLYGSERITLSAVGNTVECEGVHMVADDEDHGLAGVEVDASIILVIISGVLMHIFAPPVRGHAASLSQDIGITAA